MNKIRRIFHILCFVLYEYFETYHVAIQLRYIESVSFLVTTHGYQFYFRRLSRWSIVGQPACLLTHSSGVSFNWQSTLCSGLNTRLLEIRHSVHFLFLFSLALILCSQGPLLVRGNRGSAGHEQLFQRCEAKLRHPHLCQGAASTILPKK